MIRRRQPPPPPPSSPWAQRVAAARALIRHHRNDPTTEARLDQVEAALNDAARNQAAIRSALAHLDPDRAAAELKAALRAPSRSDHHITTLRRRHETVNTLANQLESLTLRIETTIADLETLAANTAQTMVTASEAHDPEAELDQLHIDITALAAAHQEVADLRPRPERNRP